MKARKGFTLIELLVSVAIIGILITIAVPRFTSMSSGAKRSAIKANHMIIRSSIVMYIANNKGSLPSAETDLDEYLQSTNGVKGVPGFQDSPENASYKLNIEPYKVRIDSYLGTELIDTYTYSSISS
jgi:prepilin-type N-terminal cleavage/methylation domain-containing protein